MKHELRLDNGPFSKIKEKTKTVELRLYDEKRRKIKVNDIIEFTNRVSLEKMLVKVIFLDIYNSFEELYKHYDKVCLGYNKEDVSNFHDMEKYYSKEMQDTYGVLAIGIEKI